MFSFSFLRSVDSFLFDSGAGVNKFFAKTNKKCQAKIGWTCPAGTSPLVAAYSNKLGDLLLSGCKEGPNNFSYDARIKGRFNGAFTYYALKALKAMKPGATYAEWHKAITKYLPSASYPQSPQIVGSATARKGKIFE